MVGTRRGLAGAMVETTKNTAARPSGVFPSHEIDCC